MNAGGHGNKWTFHFLPGSDSPRFPLDGRVFYVTHAAYGAHKKWRHTTDGIGFLSIGDTGHPAQSTLDANGSNMNSIFNKNLEKFKINFR